MRTSVVIPNWQGKSLLEKNLPKVLQISADEIIVIENGSTDGSLGLLQEKFPQVKTLVNFKNEGYAKGVNKGVKESSGDIIILLNTDVVPQKDLLKSVIPHFKNDDIFAVSFNEEKWSFARGRINQGLVEHGPGEKAENVRESFWASGGSAAFSREKWLKLGGMETIYSPFYWEDIDLGYRAWIQNWRVLWDPRAIVDHQHEATVKKHSQGKRREQISKRNQILFFWLNISSGKLWLSHLFWMPYRIIFLGYFTPFLLAILKLPQIFFIRIVRQKRKVKDEEIFKKFTN